MDYMKKISEYSFLWAVGGCLYYGFEILFRGFSHWTMFVLGGICLMFFAMQGRMVRWQDPFWRQIVRCIVWSVGLQQPSIPSVRADMPAFCPDILCLKRCRDPS